MPSDHPVPIAFSIKAAVEATGGAVSRTKMFELIATRAIDARKSGRRTMILADSLRRYVESLPPARAA